MRGERRLEWIVLRKDGGTLMLGAKWLGVTIVCVGMASCATAPEKPKKVARSKEYFSEKEYGVKASPRVVQAGQPVPKGGGRFLVGTPYEVKGKTYVPKEDPNYNKSGLASWYGSAFHGRLTANGEVYDSEHLSAAHPTFPLPSYARVTNLDSGSSVIVRVNDRGPYHPGRILDVSEKTADMLDMKRTGTARVNVQYVGRARMDGNDMPFLMASYSRKGDRLPSVRPEGQIATGVMVASNQSLGDQLQSYASPSPRASTSEKPALGVRTESSTKPVVAAAAQVTPTSRALPAPAERPVEANPPRPQMKAVVASAAAAPKTQPKAAPAQATAAPSVETAYAQAPSAREPTVIFGNMVLQPPPRPVR